MDWAKIAEIAIAVISAVGGSGAIIIFVGKWTFDRIADALSKKYQLQLDKEKEAYITELSKREFISKTRFEAEFKMYQDLSEKNISMVYSAGEAVVVSRGAPYTNDEINQFIEQYCEKINDAEITNRKYAPFISKELYENYLSLEKECTDVFRLIKAWKQYLNGENFSFILGQTTYQNQSEVVQAIETKQKEISNASNCLISELREYLSKLDVME